MTRHLGRYELLRLIGRGGMAEVWLARHRGAGGVEKRVVVKRILRERANDPRFLNLFVTEAQISMALTHKNIVPTFDFGRVGDELFLVMEYVEGTTLAIAMQHAGPLGQPPSPSLICHMVFEACQALEYAHGYVDPSGNALHIAHRDVTPPNLLLSAAGEVKLGDFGLAMATAGVSEAEGSTRGTPRYMSPEQAVGGVVGPSSDIFSLGLILRDCLLFSVLRKGSQAEQLAAAKCAVPPAPSSIPKDMRTICDRATQFAPGDRYPSANAMSEDLDRALLHARMAEPDDRRPMPERLSHWLLALRDKVSEEVDEREPTIQGATRTFLDDGTEEILAGLGDATMRSMAVTGIGSLRETSHRETSHREEVEQHANEPTDETVEPTPESDVIRATASKKKGSILRRAGVAALLMLPITAAVYLIREPRSLRVTRPLGTISDAGHSTATALARSDATTATVDAKPRDTADAFSDRYLDSPSDASPTQRSRQKTTTWKHTHSSSRTKAPQTVAQAKNTGTLRISSTPWATVTIEGRKESCSETPCQLTLPEASYRLKLFNPIAGRSKEVRITIVAGESTRIHEVLENRD